MGMRFRNRFELFQNLMPAYVVLILFTGLEAAALIASGPLIAVDS
jgi:hypothetical protein